MDIQEGTLTCYDVSDLVGIEREFRKSGVVLVEGALNSEKLDALILEQWEKILLRQPYTDQYRIKVTDDTGNVLDPVNDPQAFLKVVKSSPLSPKQLRHFEKGWCLHRGFGACCDPAVFHLPGVWQHVRQNPALYAVSSRLLGREDLLVDINRSIQKLPKQGEDEFLHWDLNPFAATPSAEEGAPGEETAQNPNSSGISGKLCYTPSCFVCVLGSHTPEFHQKFREQYRAIYPNVKESAAKFGLDADKSDPQELWKQQRVYPVPAGCAIFWDAKILHGQTKTPKEAPIEFGCYLGYFPAGSRPKYADVCGIDELEDRLESFRKGCAPKLWPSFDEIHYYPKRFQNFPKILRSYIDKMPPGHPSITTRKTEKGETAPHLVPTLDPDYLPPELSKLGQRLLGSSKWKGKRKRCEMETTVRDGNGNGVE